jgi:G3E family GTPase
LKTIHDEEIQSISMKIEGDVNPDLFMPWINKIVQDMGPEILRSKGILSFPNEPKRFVFQGVHMILDGDLQGEWKPNQKRESRIVFIGRRLKQDELRRGFMACAIV